MDVGCVSVYWGGLSAVPSMADKPTSTVAVFDTQVGATDKSKY